MVLWLCSLRSFLPFKTLWGFLNRSVKFICCFNEAFRRCFCCLLYFGARYTSRVSRLCKLLWCHLRWLYCEMLWGWLLDMLYPFYAHVWSWSLESFFAVFLGAGTTAVFEIRWRPPLLSGDLPRRRTCASKALRGKKPVRASLLTSWTPEMCASSILWAE